LLVSGYMGCIYPLAMQKTVQWSYPIALWTRERSSDTAGITLVQTFEESSQTYGQTYAELFYEAGFPDSAARFLLWFAVWCLTDYRRLSRACYVDVLWSLVMELAQDSIHLQQWWFGFPYCL
jgi:hypothetical protein